MFRLKFSFINPGACESKNIHPSKLYTTVGFQADFLSIPLGPDREGLSSTSGDDVASWVGATETSKQVHDDQGNTSQQSITMF